MYYIEKSIREYLNDLAAKTPAPGGGSVAALHGALGCGLLSMVCNFTIGKEKFLAVEEDIKNTLSKSEKLRDEFQKLIDLDAQTYSEVAKAYGLPKGKEREGAIKSALNKSLEVCSNIAKLSFEGIKLLPDLRKKANPNLLSDVDCAKHSFVAAFRCAMVNVEINLKSLKDEKLTAQIQKTFESMKKEIDEITTYQTSLRG